VRLSSSCSGDLILEYGAAATMCCTGRDQLVAAQAVPMCGRRRFAALALPVLHQADQALPDTAGALACPASRPCCKPADGLKTCDSSQRFLIPLRQNSAVPGQRAGEASGRGLLGPAQVLVSCPTNLCRSCGTPSWSARAYLTAKHRLVCVVCAPDSVTYVMQGLACSHLYYVG